jgi:hypothetical protein
MVILNASPEPISLPAALPGFSLHPVLRNSSDARNREARVADGQFQVPGLTVAVFVQPQQKRR